MSEMRALHTLSPEMSSRRGARLASTRRTSRLGTRVFDALFAALAALLIMTALAVRSGVETTLAARAGDLAARAVLRDDVTEEQARALADTLAREEPGLRTVVIGPAEARSRLALQENWMRHLPEVELAELPTILEVRHPSLLTEPDQVAAFYSRLENRPEVQFLQFNAIGYSTFVESTTQARRLAGRLSWSLIVTVAMLYTLFAIARRRRRSDGSGRSVISSGLGAAVGATAFSHAALTGFSLPSSGSGVTLAAVIIGAMILRLFGNWAGGLPRA